MAMKTSVYQRISHPKSCDIVHMLTIAFGLLKRSKIKLPERLNCPVNTDGTAETYIIATQDRRECKLITARKIW